MAIKAGTVADFTGSMAEAMEKALAVEYQAAKGSALPGAGVEDRRMMFAAIAQGVVRYLKDNLDAFEVESIADPITAFGDAPEVTSEIKELTTEGTLHP